jgi:hypothetical protein
MPMSYTPDNPELPSLIITRHIYTEHEVVFSGLYVPLQRVPKPPLISEDRILFTANLPAPRPCFSLIDVSFIQSLTLGYEVEPSTVIGSGVLMHQRYNIDQSHARYQFLMAKEVAALVQFNARNQLQVTSGSGHGWLTGLRTMFVNILQRAHQQINPL